VLSSKKTRKPATKGHQEKQPWQIVIKTPTRTPTVPRELKIG
jgi:hypothetical protein